MAVTYHVAVDIQNLWHSTRACFGQNYRVDYKKLVEFITNQVVPQDEEVDVKYTAYIITSPNHDQSAFLNSLKNLDFLLKKRALRYDPIKRVAQNTNWDVGITADAFAYMEDYDEFILVSGDGDFYYMVNLLKEFDVDVSVISFENSCNKLLAESASNIHYIDNECVYDPRERWQKKQNSAADSLSV